MEKHIKISKPMPDSIKRALAEKREWIRKVQAGEMPDSIKNKPKTIV